MFFFFFQFFVAKNIYLVRMKFMKFKRIVQSLAIPMIYVSCVIYAFLQDLNITVFACLFVFLTLDPVEYQMHFSY